MGIRLASVYCMTQLLVRVKNPYHLHYSDSAGTGLSEEYGVIFVKAWAVVGGRSYVVELVLCVFSSLCVCHVHDAIYIFSCRVRIYDLCVRFL